MKSQICIVLFLCFCFTNAKEIKSEDFCYDDEEDCGPSHWQGPCEQNAMHQSPIDITTNPNSALSPSMSLAFHDYDTEQYGFNIVNNGHSIQLSLASSKSAPRINYGAWGEYIFQQAHFHWGENSTVGSEHTFNGTSSPFEIHLVHFSSKYRTFDDALESDDPIALSVIGVTAQLSPSPNPGLNNVVQALQYVTVPSQIGVSVEVASFFKLDYLLPSTRDFFSYNGSLTTPPCYEEVKWTFLQHPIQISNEQLIPFRQLARNHDGELLTKNYRPIQPLGDRRVEFYRAVEMVDINAGSFTVVSSAVMLLATIAIFYIDLLNKLN